MAADKKAQRDSRYTSGDIDNKWDPSKGTDEGACAGRDRWSEYQSGYTARGRVLSDLPEKRTETGVGRIFRKL